MHPRITAPAASAAVVDTLDALQMYAAEFDEISNETGARYSATAFVRWVKLEATATRDAEPREVGQRPVESTAA